MWMELFNRDYDDAWCICTTKESKSSIYTRFGNERSRQPGTATLRIRNRPRLHSPFRLQHCLEHERRFEFGSNHDATDYFHCRHARQRLELEVERDMGRNAKDLHGDRSRRWSIVTSRRQELKSVLLTSKDFYLKKFSQFGTPINSSGVLPLCPVLHTLSRLCKTSLNAKASFSSFVAPRKYASMVINSTGSTLPICFALGFYTNRTFQDRGDRGCEMGKSTFLQTLIRSRFYCNLSRAISPMQSRWNLMTVSMRRWQ